MNKTFTVCGIAREDLIEYVKRPGELTDNEMEKIAFEMNESIFNGLDDYWALLDEVVSDVLSADKLKGSHLD